ncbi:unnamed protein product [Brassica rapa subsp. narinosa]
MLYSSGASKFVVHNVAPLGCLPIVRQEFNTGNECYEQLQTTYHKYGTPLRIYRVAVLGRTTRMVAVFLTCTRSYACIKDLIFTSTHVTTQRRHKNHPHLLFGADPNVVQPINIRELITYPVNEDMSEFWKEPVGDILLLDDGIDVKGIPLRIYRVAVLGRTKRMVAVFLTCTRSYASIKDLIFTSTHVTTQRRHKNHPHLLFGADPNVVQPINIRELITYPVNEDMSEFWKEPVGDILLLDDGIDVKVSGSM